MPKSDRVVREKEPDLDQVAHWTVWYNFARIHKTLRCSPGLATGVIETLLSLDNIVRIVDEWEAAGEIRMTGGHRAELGRLGCSV